MVLHVLSQESLIRWNAIGPHLLASLVFYICCIAYEWLDGFTNCIILSSKLVVVQSLSHIQLFATPWTAAYQASLSFIPIRIL